MFSSITRRVYSNIRASTAIPSISFCRQTAFEPNITKKSTQSKATELLHAHLYHKNDFGTVFAGVATVAAVVGAAKMWWDASGSGNNKGYANRELSREELKEILLELGTGLQQLTSQIPQFEQSIREDAKKQGIEVTDQEIKEVLAYEFPRLMQDFEKQVFISRNISPERVDAALMKFQGDEELLAIQHELQNILANNPLAMGGMGNVEIPEDLTPAKTLQVLTALMSEMSNLMQETLNEAKNAGITDPNIEMEKIQTRYLAKVQEMSKTFFNKYDINEHIFTAAMQKYGVKEDFQQEVEKLYLDQQQAFQMMGLNVNA